MCFGSRKRKVEESQAGERGLHAVGQSPGAAVPRKPRAQVAEELEAARTRDSNSEDCNTARLSGHRIKSRSLYRPCCRVMTLQRSDKREQFYVRKRSQERLEDSWQPYLQGQRDQGTTSGNKLDLVFYGEDTQTNVPGDGQSRSL